MDLANSAYGLALDLEEAIDTYNELIAEDSEEVDGEAEESVNEANCRVQVARSVLAIRSLVKAGIISDKYQEEYESLCRKLLN